MKESKEESELINLILIIFSGVLGGIVLNILGIKSNIVEFSTGVFIMISLFKLNMEIREWSKKYWVAFLLALGIMVGLYYFSPKIWSYSFAILLAYVIADGFTKYIIPGGRGIVQISISGNKTVDKGHGYLFFILVIIFGTILSGWGSNIILTNFKDQPILANLIVLALISLDFWINYYKR